MNSDKGDMLPDVNIFFFLPMLTLTEISLSGKVVSNEVRVQFSNDNYFCLGLLSNK